MILQLNFFQQQQYPTQLSQVLSQMTHQKLCSRAIPFFPACSFKATLWARSGNEECVPQEGLLQ